MSFKVELSNEQLERIEKSYERLRKRLEYKKQRLTEIFDKNLILRRIEEALFNVKIDKGDKANIKMNIEWRKDEEDFWLNYITTLHKLQRSWRAFDFSDKVFQTDETIGFNISLDVEPRIINEKAWKKGTIQRIKNFIDYGFFSPKSIHFAKYLTIETSTPQIKIRSAFRASDVLPKEEIMENKLEYHDFITLEDMPLVLNYYRKVMDINNFWDDIAFRGLTINTAVKTGESIIRRNDDNGKRFVPRKKDDVENLILNYLAYKFVPDVNLYGQEYPSRIVYDLDPSSSTRYEEFRDFTNEFYSWLISKGFKPKFRKTGGRGAHIILEMNYNKIPKTYEMPFPKSLRFKTWFKRHGEIGLLYSSAVDFVRISTLGFAVERKGKYGKRSRITTEREDAGLRLWNIFIDWTRNIKEMGIASVGSISERTGGVCIPVKKLPEKDSMEDVIKCSIDPSLKIPTGFDPKYKSPWIHLVGNYPYLIIEERISENDNPMNLVEEMFEKYGWISEKYINLGPRKFLARYCW